ncbi:DUF6538 domain-containing protein [Rhizobium sp. A22-96]
MAVRHDVENLIRRGNIFYWRARIPASFKRCRAGSRLSLSLHCSDHKKAQTIGRKLNMLLAELKMNSKEAMSTTREQLQKLCEHERDNLLSHLEDVAIVARRNGRTKDIEELEHDLESGWAYKLLEMYGIRLMLTLDDGCNGRTYLLANGVPASHIPAIAHIYREQRHVSNGRSFQDGVYKMMAQFGIEETGINHEKAMKAFFKGRAEALLDIDDRHPLAERRQSEFFGGSRLETAATSKAPAEVKLTPLVVETLHEPQAPPIAASEPVEPEEIRFLDLTPKPAQTPAFVEVPEKPLRVVMVADLESECEKLIANKGKSWEKASANDARALVRMLKSVLEEHNVEHSGQIEQFHLGQLRQHLNEIPIHWGKSARMRAMSAPELRAEGKKLREQAEEEGKEATVGLSVGTIRKHFSNLQSFMTHIRGHGFQLADWTFDGLRPKKQPLGSIRAEQFKPTPSDLEPIFSTPIYTGSLDDRRGRGKPGSLVYHDGIYFLPILYTYLGARRKELAGLALDDLAEDEAGLVIRLRSNQFRRLKNEQSKRILPVPDEMIRLGFVDYCTALSKLGYEAVFPDLFSDQTTNDPGDRFYDVFGPIMKKALGDNMWDRAIHALRHGMADTLKQAGVPTEVIDDIAGRLSDGSETNTRYTNPAGLPLMRDALSKYPIITAGIEPQPIQLLPWVQQKLPPPWARKPKNEARRRK